VGLSGDCTDIAVVLVEENEQSPTMNTSERCAHIKKTRLILNKPAAGRKLPRRYWGCPTDAQARAAIAGEDIFTQTLELLASMLILHITHALTVQRLWTSNNHHI
jgi:hypothetical protein